MKIKHKYTGKEIGGTYHYWKNNILSKHTEENYTILTKPELVDVYKINATNGWKTFIETTDRRIAIETYLAKNDQYTIQETDLSKFDDYYRLINADDQLNEVFGKLTKSLKKNGSIVITQDTPDDEEEKIRTLESLGYLNKINSHEFELTNQGSEFIDTELSYTMAKERTETKLTKAISTFKGELEERISNGIQILNSDITYIKALWEKFDDWDDYNSELLKQSFTNESNEYKKKYDTVNQLYGLMGPPEDERQKFKGKLSNKINNLKQLLAKVDLIKEDLSILKTDALAPQAKKETDKIFIVHGHNSEAKVSVARTLEKLGLEPIILHEQPNGGKTIIEKFEKYSDVGFAIVLLTNDDIGRAKSESTENNRARQNVILEMGYFIGKLGRDKVCPLYIKGVELPSDLYGLLYTEIDESETWKFKLAKEIKAAGYSIDINKIL